MNGSKPNRAKPALTSWTPAIAILIAFSGCNLLTKSGDDASKEPDTLKKLMVAPEPPDLVKQATVPHGLNYLAVEGVAIVNGLPGTGGPVAPSTFRDEMIEEMKRYDVRDPHGFLERPETALVRTQGIIPPGARRGDSMDLRLVSPSKTDATDLHGGWLMESRLRQQQTLGGAVRKSDVLAVGTGSVLSRGDHEAGEDAMLKLQGLVIGGGRIQQDRKLGLVIRPEYQHVKVSAQIAAAINERFYFFDGTKRTGIAKPIEDDFIEIQVHPRYRRNIHRMMAVVSMICPGGESAKTQSVLVELSKRLVEPTTSNEASMQLEAIGDAAIPTLVSALKNPNPEIRFHAAHSLAYLDRNEAIEPLIQAATEEAAFRYPSIIALEGMSSRIALDALTSMFDQPSMETRYGAMRSVRRRPDRDTVLRSTFLVGGYRLYKVPSTAAPFIAISLSEAPEIVCFGDEDKLVIDDFLLGPGGIVIRRDDVSPEKIRISRFVPGSEDKRAEVPATIEGLLTGIDLVGGGYGDAIAILRAAKSNNQITCGLALDPLPESQRTYYRDEKKEGSDPAGLPPQDIQPPQPKEEKRSWLPPFLRSKSS